MTRISVITATRNNQETISRLAASLQKQVFQDFEWIVQDSCSQDETVELARSIFPNAKVVSESDTSVYDAWNKATKRSTGDFIIFLGADDFLLSEYALENASRNMLSDQKIYFGGMHLFSEERKELYGYRLLSKSDYQNALDLPIHAFPPAPATFFPGQELRAREFDLTYRFHADADMYYRLAKASIEIECLYHDIAAMGDGGMTSASTGRLLRQNEKFAIWKRYRADFSRLGLRRISFVEVLFQMAKDVIKTLWNK